MNDPFETDLEFEEPDLPELWVIPIDDEPFESTTGPISAPVVEPEESPLFLSFRGSDTPPPLGFTPRLSRDNEAS